MRLLIKSMNLIQVSAFVTTWCTLLCVFALTIFPRYIVASLDARYWVSCVMCAGGAIITAWGFPWTPSDARASRRVRIVHLIYALAVIIAGILPIMLLIREEPMNIGAVAWIRNWVGMALLIMIARRFFAVIAAYFLGCIAFGRQGGGWLSALWWPRAEGWVLLDPRGQLDLSWIVMATLLVLLATTRLK